MNALLDTPSSKLPYKLSNVSMTCMSSLVRTNLSTLSVPLCCSHVCARVLTLLFRSFSFMIDLRDVALVTLPSGLQGRWR